MISSAPPEVEDGAGAPGTGNCGSDPSVRIAVFLVFAVRDARRSARTRLRMLSPNLGHETTATLRVNTTLLKRQSKRFPLCHPISTVV